MESPSLPGDVPGISLTNSVATARTLGRPRDLGHLGGGHSLPGPPPRWAASLPDSTPPPTSAPSAPPRSDPWSRDRGNGSPSRERAGRMPRIEEVRKTSPERRRSVGRRSIAPASMPSSAARVRTAERLVPGGCGRRAAVSPGRRRGRRRRWRGPPRAPGRRRRSGAAPPGRGGAPAPRARCGRPTCGPPTSPAPPRCEASLPAPRAGRTHPGRSPSPRSSSRRRRPRGRSAADRGRSPCTRRSLRRSGRQAGRASNWLRALFRSRSRWRPSPTGRSSTTKQGLVESARAVDGKAWVTLPSIRDR